VTLISRPGVMRLEIETVLNQQVGPSPSPLSTIHLVGWGVRHSVGVEGDIRLVDD
jgi:hypothetical protein